MRYVSSLIVLFLLVGTGCGTDAPRTSGGPVVQDTSQVLFSVTGLSGPEAVRYDPEQDVYFVSNFNGGGNDRDGNGFISRIGPEGTVEALRFITGTEAQPLHAPRGMFITGDTLWAADIDGIHGFDRRTGAPLTFVDATALAPGFLNDLSAGPNGVLHVTDTGQGSVYRVQNGTVEVVVDSLEDAPNGIVWDSVQEQFVLLPWGGGQEFLAWQPAESQLTSVMTVPGGYFDGAEQVGAGLLVTSQADSSLYVARPDTSYAVIKTPGRPADIGLDTQRNRVAVPYIALDRVDVWTLPGAQQR